MTRRGGLLLAVGATSLLFAGCKAEEQNRPVHLEKGTYTGQQDEALTDQQRKLLRERAERGR
ncbi:MAG: hypothetical protein JNM89_02565 [Hyphomicrobiaceae bacterium]|nr:hypothetical protein [Hyphomicrobiaceae bacterium]